MKNPPLYWTIHTRNYWKYGPHDNSGLNLEHSLLCLWYHRRCMWLWYPDGGNPLSPFLYPSAQIFPHTFFPFFSPLSFSSPFFLAAIEFSPNSIWLTSRTANPCSALMHPCYYGVICFLFNNLAYHMMVLTPSPSAKTKWRVHAPSALQKNIYWITKSVKSGYSIISLALRKGVHHRNVSV